MTDILLPIMDGFELCHRLKSIPGTEMIPVIMMSAIYMEEEDHGRGIKIGAKKYINKPDIIIEKPINFDNLINHMHYIFGDSQDKPSEQSTDTLLIVDDDPRTLRLLKMSLAPKGYHLFEATDARTALEIVANERIDVVLSDIRMPGMSGLELLQEIRLSKPHITIVMMTGSRDVAVEAMKLGANDYLTKPLDITELDVVLRENLAKHRLKNDRDRLRNQLKETSRNLISRINASERNNILLENSNQRINQSKQEEKILLQLLQYSFEPMDDFLNNSLNSVTSIPWLSLSNKGGVFLIDNDHEKQTLNLTYSHNLAPEVLELCTKVPFGQCFCGSTLTLKTIQFIDANERYENRHQSMQHYSHYNVPLMHGDRLLGVMVLYVEQGHKGQHHESQFLDRVSRILGLGISKHIAESQVRKQAYYDPLTDLPNRYLLLDRLQQAYTEANRHNTQGALIFIDLDHFKNINDSFGHINGDQVLKQVAQRFRRALREEDTLARHGGDEFIILLKSINVNREQAIIEIKNILEKLRAIIKNELLVNEHSLFVTMSCGIAFIPDDGENVHELLSHADAAMYQAKNQGRNTFALYSKEMQKKSDEKRRLEADLRSAIRQNQFIIYYQPQVNESNLIVGVEALLYWRHPRRGVINPSIFIPIAEETGLILEIGEWLMNTACSQFKTFLESDSVGLLKHIAVNVSVHQFHHHNFFNM